MKIELWYDAVVQETDILINEMPVEKNDVYGFLYQVRNYPIQSWIYPNGSWKGIERQILDLARDERGELIFHGRRCDYEDLSRCLAENDDIDLQFVEWDISSRYDELFSNLLSTLKDNDDLIQELLTLLMPDYDHKVDFDISAAESNWAYHIFNDSDLAGADEIADKRCCYIHDSFFTSYDKLPELLSLTRSMKLPADAVYCCFRDEQTKEEYKYYAQSFKRMGFRFCLEDSGYAEAAKIKYGLPFIVKRKMEKSGELLQILCDAYLKLKEETRDEFNRLAKNIVTLDPQQKERFDNLKQLRSSVDNFRFGMEIIYKYIDILLSVSKDNKEEVFHYECIDKLDENIKLYLNTKSLIGVN